MVTGRKTITRRPEWNGKRSGRRYEGKEFNIWWHNSPANMAKSDRKLITSGPMENWQKYSNRKDTTKSIKSDFTSKPAPSKRSTAQNTCPFLHLWAFVPPSSHKHCSFWNSEHTKPMYIVIFLGCNPQWPQLHIIQLCNFTYSYSFCHH